MRVARRVGLIGAVLLAVGAAGCAGAASPAGSSIASSSPSSSGATTTEAPVTSATAPATATATATASSAPATTTTPTTTAAAAAQPAVSLTQPATALAKGLTVSTVIGGGTAVDMTVDTGSNGVLVSRKWVGTAATPLSPARPFSGFGYSSSGNTYSGEWMTATLQLGAPGGSDHPVQTVPMLIRVTDEDGVAMMGVGFDRGGSGPDADLDGSGLNPFLQLTGMRSGVLPQSYVVGLDRIVLGAGPADLGGFQTVALTRDAAGTDWNAPSACIAVPSGGVAPQCGGLLLDTGLDYAIVLVPTGVEPPTTAPVKSGDRPTVAAGQQVQVTMDGLSGPLYDFTVGGSGAPTSVQWGHDLSDHGNTPFMNISRYALTQHDYLYDASTGQVGFRPVTDG